MGFCLRVWVSGLINNIGGSKGGARDECPRLRGLNFFIFMQFSAKKFKNNSTFSPRENSGSATESVWISHISYRTESVLFCLLSSLEEWCNNTYPDFFSKILPNNRFLPHSQEHPGSWICHWIPFTPCRNFSNFCLIWAVLQWWTMRKIFWSIHKWPIHFRGGSRIHRRSGHQTFRRGHQPMILPKFSKKDTWNWDNFGPWGGACQGCPLRSATAFDTKIILHNYILH